MSFTNMQDHSARMYKEREAKNGTAAQQQKHAEEWSAWFKRQLANEDELFKAFGESLADVKREIRAEFEPLLVAMKEEAEELKNRVKQLETQLSLDSRFKQLERDLAARQAALDEGRRGAPGRPGARGERGLRGERGEKGENGERGAAPKLRSVQIDRKKYQLTLLFDDGSSWEPLDFQPFLEQFLSDRGEW